MRKLFTILALLTVYVFLNAQVNVLYVTKEKTSLDPAAGDDPVLAMLQNDDNFVVTVNSDAASPVGDVSSYDLLVLSEALSSSDAVIVSTLGLDIRFLNMKVYGYKPGVWSWGTASDGPGPDIHIVEGAESHPIFEGVTITDNKVTLFKRTTDDNGATGTKATNYAYSLAAMTGDILRLAYPEGAPEADAVNIQACDDPTATCNAVTIPKKYVLLGFNYGAMVADGSTNLTDDGTLIIANSIQWLVGDLIPSSVDNKFSHKLNAYGITGNIRIITESPVDVSIYSVDGRLVKQVLVNSTSNIPCESGLYLVNVAGAGVAKVYVTR